jgi:hypothetical protein
MEKTWFAVGLLSLCTLAGCVSYPQGPSVMVLPGRGKTFDQFRQDDMDCRNYAQYQSGGRDAAQSATSSAVESAAVGTAIGAAAGALIGGNHQGAAVGAGAGLLTGSLAGSGAANTSARLSQRSYDQAYIQCMYAKGERVPVQEAPVRAPTYAAPPAYYRPPPPPGW